VTETGIIAVVGIAATFLGTVLSGLGGAWLANNHAKNQELARRSFEVQAAARSLVVTILIEGRALREQVFAVGATLATTLGDPEADERYLNRILTQDDGMGGAINGHDKRLRRALTEALLLVRDDSLRQALLTFQERLPWYGEITGMYRGMRDMGIADETVLMQPTMKWASQFDLARESIEELSRRLVASPLATE
jgi:hypothetical protein